MPLRGETIGTAYVRILASGRGFDQSVKDQFDDADETFERGGRDASNAWDKGFADEQQKNRNIDKSLDRTMNRAFGEVEARNKFFNGSFVDRLNEKVVAKLKQSNPELSHAAEELGKHMSDGILKDFARNGEFDLNLSTRLRDALIASQKDSDEATKKWRAEFEQTSNEIDKTLRESSRELVTFSEKVTRTYDTIRSSHTSMARDWMRDNDSIRRELEKTNKALAKSRDPAKSFIQRMDDMGDAVGRAFGKGKRNDFVNLVGSMIGAIASLPGTLAKAAVGIAKFGQTLGQTFTDAGGGVSGFVAVAGKILPAVGAAGVALIGLTAVVGTATTAMLLAAGAAAALVSSLAFGLVGAIAPIVGLLGPLSLAAFGTAAAFIGMSDAAKKNLKDAFKPIKNDLIALGNAARPGILDGITDAAKNLAGPLERLRPLFRIIGNSIGAFTDAASTFTFGKGFDEFVTVMGISLPETMRSLGTIAGNTLNGIMGLFATLQPVTFEFLGALERITGAFAAWTISSNASTFFRDAADSAGALLDFLGPVLDLTMEILDAGKQTGDSLFRSMGDAVQGWVDAIRANPDLLSDFFADAQRMGEAIGRAVVEVGRLIGALDTPVTRDFAVGLVDKIGDIIRVLADLVGWFGGLNEGAQQAAIGFGIALAAWGPLSSAFSSSRTGITNLIGNLTDVETRAGTLSAAARGLAGPAGLGLITAGAVTANKALSTLELAAGGAALGFAAGGPLGAALGGAAGLTVGLMKNFSDTGQAAKDMYKDISAIDPVEEANKSLQDLAATLDETTGAYTQATRAAVLKKLSDEGLIDVANKYGVSSRALVNAALGQGQAWQAINPVAQNLESRIALLGEAQRKMAGDMDNFDSEGFTADAQKRFNALGAEKKALQEDLAVLTRMPGELAKMSAAQRRAAAASADYTGKLKAIPKKIRSKIEATGIIPTTKGVARVAAQYKLLDRRKIRALIQASGADTTVKQVRRVIAQMDTLGKRKPKPKVDVDTKEGLKKLSSIRDRLLAAQRAVTKPKVGINDAEFNTKNASIRRKADETGKIEKTIKVNANTTSAEADIASLRSSLNIPDEYVTIHVNTVRTGGRATADGGVFFGAQNRLIGEAGPEAVVPLARPLSMVDPAVRAMSAFAQGLGSPTLVTSPSAQTVVDVGGISIITPTRDPSAVAQEVVNRLVATGY